MVNFISLNDGLFTVHKAVAGLGLLFFIAIAFGCEGSVLEQDVALPTERAVEVAVGLTPTVVPYVDTEADFEGCVTASYVGIGVDPLASDERIDFLVKDSANEAEAALLIAETWCASLAQDVTADERVTAGDYESRQINEWFGLIGNYNEFSLGAYLRSGKGSSAKRLEYSVMTEFDRTLLLATVNALEIPLDALTVDVWENASLTDPPVNPVGRFGIQVSYGWSYSGIPGEPVNISVFLENDGDDRVDLSHGTDSTTEVFIFTEGGRQVWRSGQPLIAEGGGDSSIAPGRRVQFEKRWALVNEDGYAVPDGRYLIRACARFQYDRDLTDGVLVKEYICTRETNFDYSGDVQ